MAIVNTISDEAWKNLQDRARQANPLPLGSAEQVRRWTQRSEQLRAAREGRQ